MAEIEIAQCLPEVMSKARTCGFYPAEYDRRNLVQGEVGIVHLSVLTVVSRFNQSIKVWVQWELPYEKIWCYLAEMASS